MPVISRTKIQHTGGSTMESLVVGESFSGRIILKITKDILFSYSTTDDPESVEVGAVGGSCYQIRRTPHHLKWKAKIHVRTEKTLRTLIRRVVNGIASDVEQAGAVVTAGGSAIVAVGGVIAATAAPAPPSAPVTLPAGGTVAAVGGLITAVGGVLWGAGAFVRWLTDNETTVTEDDKDEEGTRDFESVTIEQIECLPNETYSAIVLPKQISAAEAENDAVVAILGELGF